MVELEQYKFTVNQYKEPMKELGVSLALSHKHEQIKELESEMREEGFWNDPDKAQEVTRKVKNLKDTVSAYHALELTLDDVSTMIELGNEENDASVIPDIEELLGEFEIEFDNLKIQTLLSGEYDKNNAIVTLHATVRTDVGKKATHELRKNNGVPCVLYGVQKDENGLPEIGRASCRERV